MVEYVCKCCSFTTDNKSKYNRHLNTKKHKNSIKFSEREDQDKEISELLKDIHFLKLENKYWKDKYEFIRYGGDYK